MICEISLGKSFFHCISYCLEDKQELTDEQKIKLSRSEGVQHTNRAEVLAYNKCFGNKHELAEQFNDVRKLSRRVEKPVLHLSLRLAPGELLNKSQLLEIAETMTKELGVANNQYLVVQHRDTKEQHIHIVANRVGYNGKAASTSNNYFKMDKLCRRLELKYQLQQVLSPRQFLPKEMRHIPRHDIRKHVRHSLAKAKHYEDFASRMQSLGYKIIKGRGITFIDDKKVVVKGSELGYSLMTIEKTLQLKQQRNIKQEKLHPTVKNSSEKRWLPNSPLQKNPPHFDKGKLPGDQSSERHTDSLREQVQKGAADLFHQLTRSEHDAGSINPELLNQLKHKRKKKQHLHL